MGIVQRLGIVSRYKLVITLAFEMLMVMITYLSIVNGQSYIAANALFACILIALPLLLEAYDVIVLPFELVIIIFIDLTLHNLGIAFLYYDDISWWSPMMHFMSTTLVATLGLMLVIVVDYYMDEIYLPRKWLWFFILVFAMSIGVFWEIVEFSCDVLLGTNMQYSYLDGVVGVVARDTVEDLTFDLIGGLAVGILGPFYLKYRSVDVMVQNFRMSKTMNTLIGGD